MTIGNYIEFAAVWALPGLCLFDAGPGVCTQVLCNPGTTTKGLRPNGKQDFTGGSIYVCNDVSLHISDGCLEANFSQQNVTVSIPCRDLANVATQVIAQCSSQYSVKGQAFVQTSDKNYNVIVSDSSLFNEACQTKGDAK